MGYQLWISPITGQRRRGTSFAELSALFEKGLTVASISETLRCCSVDDPVPAAAETLREKKTPVYETIVHGMFRVMFSEKLGQEAPDKEEIARWFLEAMEKLSIWGSNDLIVAFGKFKSDVGDPIKALFAFEELILAIRKDLGHKQGLDKARILRLFVNDIDEYL